MKKQSGFTLIELVIVIVILGVLSAVAIPKFVQVRSAAKLSSIKELKATLEAASTLTHIQARLEGAKIDSYLQTLSTGVQIRYGYPHATQTNLQKLIDINDNWRLAKSTPVIFAFTSDTEDMTVDEIEASTEICKLVFTGAALGEQPNISISGCDE